MKKNKYELWQMGEYRYSMSFGFVPNLVSYLHDEDLMKRPCILVVPGGGYRMVSPTEGEIVAKKFYDLGYQTFVCTYTTNLLGMAPLKMQPVQDLSRAVRYLRQHADEFQILPEQLVLCGFSAGAHLCGSLCVHHEKVQDANNIYQGISNCPNAAILSYPVITSGEKAHKDSFLALLGPDASKEEMEYMSLEKQVTAQTPPCFLWQTATDEAVPVENSYLMVQALKQQNVSFAHHVFSQGKHGLSLADERWARGDCGEPFTMDQTNRLVDAVRSDLIPLPEEAKKQVLEAFDYSEEKGREMLSGNIPNNEAAIWPLLAHTWLKQITDGRNPTA